MRTRSIFGRCSQHTTLESGSLRHHVAAAKINDIRVCSWDAGIFLGLHVLNLSDVFSTSQQSERQKESMLTDIIEGTSGHLRELYLDKAHVGKEAAQAIAQKCTQLEELSLYGCTGLTDTELKCIAIACKRLQVLHIGGGVTRYVP